MSRWEIVALPQGDEIMKDGRIADTAEAEHMLNTHDRLVEVAKRLIADYDHYKNDEIRHDYIEWIVADARELLKDVEKGND